MSGAAPGVAVRDARADEHGAIAALTLGAYAEYARTMAPPAWAGLEAAVRAALASVAPAERIVAVGDGGALLGSVQLYPAATDPYGGATPRARWPEVRLLAVAPTARGLGVGRALMDECVRRARAAGAASLGLHSSRSMAAALGLYRTMGFVRMPELDFQPPGGETVEGYRLALDAAAAEASER